jgi:hypothetical protein
MKQISRHLEIKQKYVAGKQIKFSQIQLHD